MSEAEYELVIFDVLRQIILKRDQERGCEEQLGKFYKEIESLVIQKS